MLTSLFTCSLSTSDCQEGKGTFKVEQGNAFVLRPGQVASSPHTAVTIGPSTKISGRFSTSQLVAGIAGSGIPLLLLILGALLVIFKQRRSYRLAMMSSHERAKESWGHSARSEHGFKIDKRGAVEMYTPHHHEVPGDDRMTHELDAKNRSSITTK